MDLEHDHSRFHIATELPSTIAQRYDPAKHIHVDIDSMIAADKREEDQGRLVLTNAGRPDETGLWNTYKLQARGLGGLSYWCRCPNVPDAWRKLKRAGDHGYAVFESHAVVLTTLEIDAIVGSETVAGLSQRVEQLWGGILPESVFTSELFHEWLSYFIKHNHDFGIVHAWVSALRERLRYRSARVYVTKDWDMRLGLAGPSAYVDNEDGEVLAGLVAPVLERRMDILDGNPVITPEGPAPTADLGRVR